MSYSTRFLLLGLGLTVLLGTAFYPKPDRAESTYFAVDTMARNLIVPWAIRFLPDGAMLFTERAGRVRLYRANRLLEKPLLTLPDVVTTKKMGLLGLCLHPDFARNRLVYVAYNYQPQTAPTPLLKVVRYTLQTDTLLNPTPIVGGILANQNHTGCRLAFGPDRKLYVTTGDADRPALAQDLKSLNGKILRLNDDGSIPTDNPFVRTDTARREIWTYGHRNPQGLAFQPGTNHLFASEHGPSGGDEINQIVRGTNYGWPRVHHRDTLRGTVPPIAEYTPSVGPSEATFYTGRAFPALQGMLLVASLRGESILRLRMEGSRITGGDRWLSKRFGRIRALTVGPDGFIYFSTSQHDPPEGTPRPDYDLILRIRPASSVEPLALNLTPLPAADSPTQPKLATNETTALQYRQLCGSCHGIQLEGTDRAKGLKDTPTRLSRAEIARTIRYGIADKGMPAWDGAMSAADIDKLTDYLIAQKK